MPTGGTEFGRSGFTGVKAGTLSHAAQPPADCGAAPSGVQAKLPVWAQVRALRSGKSALAGGSNALVGSATHWPGYG